MATEHALALATDLTAVVRHHVLQQHCSPQDVIVAWLAGYVSSCIASDLTSGEMHEMLSDQLDQLRMTLRVRPEAQS